MEESAYARVAGSRPERRSGGGRPRITDAHRKALDAGRTSFGPDTQFTPRRGKVFGWPGDTAVTLDRARRFIEAVRQHDFETAQTFLDPEVETVTPRSTLRGVASCRRVLEKAGGDEQFTMEQTGSELEEIDGDVVSRTHEIARWRETGDVAYEREVAVRLTFRGEKIVRLVVMPGG